MKEGWRRINEEKQGKKRKKEDDKGWDMMKEGEKNTSGYKRMKGDKIWIKKNKKGWKTTC